MLWHDNHWHAALSATRGIFTTKLYLLYKGDPTPECLQTSVKLFIKYWITLLISLFSAENSPHFGWRIHIPMSEIRTHCSTFLMIYKQPKSISSICEYYRYNTGQLYNSGDSSYVCVLYIRHIRSGSSGFIKLANNIRD